MLLPQLLGLRGGRDKVVTLGERDHPVERGIELGKLARGRDRDPGLERRNIDH